MLRNKIETLFIFIAVLVAGFFAYRHFSSSFQKDTSPMATNLSHSAPAQNTKAPVSVSATSQPLPPDAASQKQASSAPPIMASKGDLYKELLKDPSKGLERLNLIDQMRSEESRENLSMMAYYEVLNSGPIKGASLEENHQRRNVVSVAFGMYLDQCLDFKACYQYAVTALARYPDQEIVDDLLLQVYEKYPEPWQQKQLQAEMKKFGLKPNNKRLK